MSPSGFSTAIQPDENETSSSSPNIASSPIPIDDSPEIVNAPAGNLLGSAASSHRFNAISLTLIAMISWLVL